MSALAPIDSKLSPALPPPERTTSAGPAGGSGAASRSSGPRLSVVSPTLSRIRSAPQREQYDRRLRALKAALRAVDMTHWPPPRIDPRSPASTCSPALDRFARSARDDVDLRVHHPSVEGDVVLLVLEAPDLGPEGVVVHGCQIRKWRRARRPPEARPSPSRSVDRTTTANASRSSRKPPAPSTWRCARPGGCRCAREAGGGGARRRLPHPRVGRARPPARHRRAAAGRGAFPRAPFRSGTRVCEEAA